MLLLMLMVMMVVIVIAYKDKIPLDNPIFAQVKGILKNQLPKVSGDIFICKDKVSGENVHIPLKDRFLHMLILGPTGSGKSSLLLLPMLKQDIENHEVGVLLIEPKGDLADKVFALAQLNGREALYFNPSYDKCPKFNPLEGDESVVIENMIQIFRMFLSDSPDYFKDSVERLIRLSLKVLKRTKANPTFLDFEAFLQNTGGIGENTLMRLKEVNAKSSDKTIQKENIKIIQILTKEYFDTKNEFYLHTSSLRTQLTRINDNEYLRNVLNPKSGLSDINFSQVIESKMILSMTTAQGVLNQTLSTFLGRLLIMNFQSAVLKRPGTEDTRTPFFFYSDEFQEFTDKRMNILLTQGRSYRVGTVLATQNRQLITGDGKQDGYIFLESVSANCRNIILLPDLPFNDTEYYANTFGMKVEKRVSHSKSGNRSEFGYTGFSKTLSLEDRQILSPTDIMQQPFGNVTYKIVAKNTAQKASIGTAHFIDAETNKHINLIVTANHALLSAGYHADSIDMDIKLTQDVTKLLEEVTYMDDEF